MIAALVIKTASSIRKGDKIVELSLVERGGTVTEVDNVTDTRFVFVMIAKPKPHVFKFSRSEMVVVLRNAEK